MKHVSTVFTTERRHLLDIIDGSSEGVILLDMNRRITWANASALAMHGATELADLGGTAAGYRRHYTLKYRNQRKLIAGQYPMDRALAADPVKDVVVEIVNKNDPAFRRVHQTRSITLNDAQGKPEGVAMLTLDVTDRHDAQERFENTFRTNPAPAVIYALQEQRYIKVNHGFLKMTGLERQDVLDHGFDEVDVLGDSPQRAEAQARMAENRSIAQMETCIALPDGSDKLVIVAGQPIEIGDCACMLFTFNDLESRRKTENALRDSQELFSKAFRLAPVPMTLSTLEGKALEINEAFIAATGYTLDMLDHTENAFARLCMEPQDYEDTMAELRDGNSIRNQEFRLSTQDGLQLDCLVCAERVAIQNEDCILVAFQDITERKRSETELMAAIEAVMQDTSWFSQTVIEKLAQLRQPQNKPKADAQLADLTPREREILGLMCQGLNDPDIAKTLSVSQHTVRNHIASLYSKLHVHRRSAAIVWARERGIVGYEKPVRNRRPRR